MTLNRLYNSFHHQQIRCCWSSIMSYASPFWSSAFLRLKCNTFNFTCKVGLSCDPQRGNSLPAGIEYSLWWNTACWNTLKLFCQAGKMRQLWCMPLPPHRWILLSWNGWQRHVDLYFLLQLIFWGGWTWSLFRSLLPCWGNHFVVTQLSLSLLLLLWRYWWCFVVPAWLVQVWASRPQCLHSCQAHHPQDHQKSFFWTWGHVHDILCISLSQPRK